MSGRGLRIGVDLGGTKIEALAIAADGAELARERVATPKGDYAGTVEAIRGLVLRLELGLGERATVGVGIPGTLDVDTGLVKNANSTCLIGHPLDKDLGKALGREVRLANDANCMAVSEASDGAAAGFHMVFGVIVGTGCGGGLAIGGKVHGGRNGVAGEWGHNAMPWMTAEEFPGPECYCGRRGCVETFLSGTALERDFREHAGKALKGVEIVAAAEGGDAQAEAALVRLEGRMARALAGLVNVLDPDIIVLGGGLSRIQRLYQNVPPRMVEYVFGRGCKTPVVEAKHGDSTGVRGAAWLFSVEEAMDRVDEAMRAGR